MKYPYLTILMLMIFLQVVFVTAHDDGSVHDEDDNSGLVFLGIFVALIILAFVVSSHYGKKTREKLYGKPEF